MVKWLLLLRPVCAREREGEDACECEASAHVRWKRHTFACLTAVRVCLGEKIVAHSARRRFKTFNYLARGDI